MDASSAGMVGYVIGTLTGLLLSWKFVAQLTADSVIKVLADNGYINYTTDENGDIELLPLDKTVDK